MIKSIDEYGITNFSNDLGLVDIETEQLKGRADEFDKSVGNYKWYNPLIDPCCLYLATYLRNLLFHYFYDFSKTFNKLKRALAIIGTFLVVSSYLHLFKMHVQA